MESRSGSIYVREPNHMLETGTVIDGHLHNFDHTTFFLSGHWKVEMFDGDKCIASVKVRGGTPGARLLIEANRKHRLELLQGPGCYACVYSHRTPEGDVITEYNGWHSAYDEKLQ